MVEGLKGSEFDGHILYCFHYVAVMEMGAQLRLVPVHQPRSSWANAVRAATNER